MPLPGIYAVILILTLSGPCLHYPELTKAYFSPGPAILPATGSTYNEIQIDSLLVRAFAGATGPSGTIYVALAPPEPVIKFYRSTTAGNTWDHLFTIPIPAPARQLELLAPKADSAWLYLFFLDTAAGGDLYLLRLKTNTDTWQLLPVALGPDTIDRFTATVDSYRHYYLYCLYVNQHRTGANGRFTRSLDYGSTWETTQEFYNCLDPCLYFGAGSVLHCVWRFALNGREIHYSRNRHYGAPSRWEQLKIIAATGEKCFDPQVVQADTSPPWRAPLWIAWTVAHRDTEQLDIGLTHSTDGGNSFAPPVIIGEPFVDEWWPALTADARSAWLVYNAGAKGQNDPTVLYLHYARAYAPELWSGPLKINNPRVNALVFGARPRILPPGALFSHYGYPFARGLFFRSSAPGADHPGVATLTSSSTLELTALDITGRKIPLNRTRPAPGVYFVLSGSKINKLLILK